MKIQSLTLDGRKYDVAPYVGSESFKIAFLLQQKVIPALANILGGFDTSKGFSNALQSKIDLSVIKTGLDDLFNNIGSDEDAFQLVRRILAGVSVYGVKQGDRIYHLSSDGDFDEYFSGQIDILYKLIVEVLKINYPFFGRAMSSLSRFTSQTDTSENQETTDAPEPGKSESSANSPKKSKARGPIGSLLGSLGNNQPMQ